KTRPPGSRLRGMTTLFDVNEFVIRGIGEERAEERVVERMAGAATFETADDRCTGKGQVADRVEDLVAHEFIFEALQSGVAEEVTVDSERVPERSAVREAGRAQCVQFGDESERPRRRAVVLE